MASGESQKQLLSLIRDFSTDKSRGERRFSDLKKRLLELQSDLDAANEDLEGAKRSREAAEQELHGSQVQRSISDALVQAQETRICLLQEKVSKLGCNLSAIKNEEAVVRDEFINTMCKFNTKIRQFQAIIGCDSQKNLCLGLSSDYGTAISSKGEAPPAPHVLTHLEEKAKCLSAQVHALEGEYQKELNDHDEVCQELADIERRVRLVEAVLKETKELQELAGQTSELEKAYASLGEELQKRFLCPNCGFNNIGALEGT